MSRRRRRNFNIGRARRSQLLPCLQGVDEDAGDLGGARLDGGQGGGGHVLEAQHVGDGALVAGARLRAWRILLATSSSKHAIYLIPSHRYDYPLKPPNAGC